MLANSPRIGVVGHHTWFANHFPECWSKDKDLCCLDVDERDYRFLIQLINFRPDLTLFYRPELYPARFLKSISGYKIAFLSEPVPPLVKGEFVRSPENDLRLRVYERMQWDCYDKIYYYDLTKKLTIQHLGWPVDDFRPMPIDTQSFKPGNARRDIDVVFVGKPTPHRIESMDFLRLAPLNFIWVAHGVSGKKLAWLFRNAKVVLNIHADALPALEPRLHLAASCGCIVLTEPVDGSTWPFEDRIVQLSGRLSLDQVECAIRLYDSTVEKMLLSDAHNLLSARTMLNTEISRILSLG